MQVHEVAELAGPASLTPPSRASGERGAELMATKTINGVRHQKRCA